MNLPNRVLAAVHEFLKSSGRVTYFNLTARVGVPCVGGVPNVTVGRDVGIQCDGSELIIINWSPQQDLSHADYLSGVQVCHAKLDLADPNMFDKLEVILDEIDSSREDIGLD